MGRAMTNDPIGDKERLETCVELYKQQMDHYHHTQEVEWKGTFGAWSMGAAAVAATFGQGLSVRWGLWVWFTNQVISKLTWARN